MTWVIYSTESSLVYVYLWKIKKKIIHKFLPSEKSLNVYVRSHSDMGVNLAQSRPTPHLISKLVSWLEDTVILPEE